MEKIAWNESFSVGVAQLDHQHHRIVGLINQLLEEPGDRFEPAVVSEVLNDLMKFVHDHFETEEQLLAQHDYPGLQEQKQDHKDFRIQLAGFCLDAMQYDARIPADLLCFLKAWWEDHILVKDMKYRSFFLGLGLR
jgi:hemerythrin